jgi:ribosomal protein S18 acetylase RimI-like enzyme/SAM-dependent methyltransferase
MTAAIRLLGPDDAAVLDSVADGVFDFAIDPRWTREFFTDPRHHLAVAIADGTVVGMATAVHYVHPDKPPELWVNEVGVAPPFRGQQIGRRLLAALFARGRALGCTEAWLGTEPDNTAARRMYAAAGGTEQEMVYVTFELGGERAAFGDVETPASTVGFYDDLVEYYDLIYEDWEASMDAQGETIARLIGQDLGAAVAASGTVTVLDETAGIGTQALPLARRGFRVTARDLSQAAMRRLEREARARKLDIDTGVADVRSLMTAVNARFDVAISFDNALPHLTSDAELRLAFEQLRGVLRPGGILLCSVRDYDRTPRETVIYPYGERTRDGRRYHVHQEWHWDGPNFYDATMVIARELPAGREEVLRTSMRYYAVGVPRLLELMSDAGFTRVRRVESDYPQPVLVGHRED